MPHPAWEQDKFSGLRLDEMLGFKPSALKQTRLAKLKPALPISIIYSRWDGHIEGRRQPASGMVMILVPSAGLKPD